MPSLDRSSDSVPGRTIDGGPGQCRRHTAELAGDAKASWRLCDWLWFRAQPLLAHPHLKLRRGGGRRNGLIRSTVRPAAAARWLRMIPAPCFKAVVRDVAHHARMGRFLAANDHIVTATGFHPRRHRSHHDQRNRRRQHQPVRGGEDHKLRREKFADWDVIAQYPDFWRRTSTKFLDSP